MILPGCLFKPGEDSPHCLVFDFIVIETERDRLREGKERETESQCVCV